VSSATEYMEYVLSNNRTVVEACMNIGLFGFSSLMEIRPLIFQDLGINDEWCLSRKISKKYLKFKKIQFRFIPLKSELLIFEFRIFFIKFFFEYLKNCCFHFSLMLKSPTNFLVEVGSL